MTENDNVRERLARAVNAALDTWEYDNADGVTQSEHVSDAILNEFPELGREPEWEYALRAPGDAEPFSDVYPDLGTLADCETGIIWQPEKLVRRRKAGPWLPVEGEMR